MVERKQQHILNVARAVTFHSNAPTSLWNFSIKHVVHLINKIPSPLIQNKCPYEMLFNSFPVLIHIKIVGCLCFATTLQAHRTKFQPRVRKAMFLGSKGSTKGYLLYNILYHELFVSRNVIFYETIFPFKTNNLSVDNPQMPKLMDNTNNLEIDMGLPIVKIDFPTDNHVSAPSNPYQSPNRSPHQSSSHDSSYLNSP